MMKIPLWKQWLSYFAEQPLESTSSEYNPQLHVSLNRGRLQLSADEAIYSYGDLYANFRRTFQRLDFSVLPERAHVLLLGLGLGSIPQMLEQYFHRKYTYTAVEIDDVIIELASEYVLHQLESPIEIICGDARAFVQSTPDRYDMICMDVFQDAEIPADFEGTDFLHQLADRLQPGGVLLYNRLASTAKTRSRSREFFAATFQEVFPQSAAIDTGGNLVLVSPAGAFGEGVR